METTPNRKRRAAEQPVTRSDSKPELKSNAEVCSKEKPDIDPEFVCSVCHDIMVDPAVARCGHDLCRHCWVGWLQVQRSCPVCRSPLPSQIPATCFRLKNLVERLHPEAVAARRAELGPKLEQTQHIQGLPPRVPRTFMPSSPPLLPEFPSLAQGSQIGSRRAEGPSSSSTSIPVSVVVSTAEQMRENVGATLGAIDRMLRGISDIQTNLEEVQTLLPLWSNGPPLEQIAFTIGAESEQQDVTRRRSRRRRGSHGGGGQQQQ